jgi:site-specific DNA recombinase
MKQLMMIHKSIATYARVSTSNQEDQKTIETQLSAVKEFAKARGYTIVKEYTDEGWSGDAIVRPALDQLRVDAKKKLWESVLIYDPDRLARRYSYQELVTDELREAGIEVLFVTTPTPKDGIERILFGVQGLFAEYERAKIAERFRLGKVRKANEGNIIATEAPYGYTLIPKKGTKGDIGFEQTHYVVNESEAHIVKNIFSWVANDGLTLRQVVLRLNELNILPRKSKRGVWSTSTLSTLLRNKSYIGEAHYGGSFAVAPINPLKKEAYKKTKKSSRKMKPENEWIKIKVPPIINEVLFENTQKQLKSNFELCKRKTKNEYLLSHKIYCVCGERRAGEGSYKSKHLYYRCIGRVKSFPLASKCTEKGINAKVTDALVWNKVRELMSSPELLIKQAERWLNNQASATPQTSVINIEDVKREVLNLERQCERFVKAYAESILTIEQLNLYTKPLKEKLLLLNNQVQQAQVVHENTVLPSIPKEQEIVHFAQKASKGLNNLSFEDKKAIMMRVIDRVIGNKEKLEVHGFLPITSNSNVSIFTNHRNGQGTNRHFLEHTNTGSIPFVVTIKIPEYKDMHFE